MFILYNSVDVLMSNYLRIIDSVFATLVNDLLLLFCVKVQFAIFVQNLSAMKK